MRKRDKLKNIEQANLRLEQSYLRSKGLLKENPSKIFESNGDEEFLITQETTPDELNNNLSEYVDTISDYGMGYMIVDKINSIIYKSLLAIGKNESEAEKIADDFTKKTMKEDHRTDYNEYDEGKISGIVKYNNGVIFEYKSHDDGYAFGGEFSNLSELLKGIRELLG